MNAPNDGGPAFPRPSDQHYNSAFIGMTLRDWFAGMALQGMLANLEMKVSHGTYAEVAYRHADQMLAAREGKENT